MITLLIIGLILFAVSGIIACIVEIKDIDKDTLKGIPFVMLFVLIIGALSLSMAFQKNGERGAYKNALNGSNPYEKVYRYERTDTGYVKIDSIYRKKEN